MTHKEIKEKIDILNDVLNDTKAEPYVTYIRLDKVHLQCHFSTEVSAKCKELGYSSEIDNGGHLVFKKPGIEITLT